MLNTKTFNAFLPARVQVYGYGQINAVEVLTPAEAEQVGVRMVGVSEPDAALLVIEPGVGGTPKKFKPVLLRDVQILEQLPL